MNNESELMSNISNLNTKSKIGNENIINITSKEINEDLLNYKLSLRKKKTQNTLMQIRLKDFNKNNKPTTKQKMYEYKKLFEINKIKEIKDKLLQQNSNYIKDKKIIELILLYSQHINSDENIQNILDLNNNNLINIFFNEIIRDINSISINLELFDYYLIILGNFFIYMKNVYENKEKEYINLFLNILNKNSFLEIYDDINFYIINDTLWLIHLYIYFNINDYIYNFSSILKNIEYFLSNKFLEILTNFYQRKNNKHLFLNIIKEIIYTLFNIYSLIYEQIIDDINNNIIIDIPNEIFQNSFNNLLNLLNYDLTKDIYNENITDILALLFSIKKIYININIFKNKFFEILSSMFNKYKYENYDNNKISQNLIIILNKLIDNYYEDEIFVNSLKESDILPICIQYYLKNGALINMTLITMNLFFKYQINYNKIIIKCINYKLIEYAGDILSKTENKEKNCFGCLNILLNSYYFLKNNIKNKTHENIIKYFNINNGLISKLEQLFFSNNKDIIKLSSELYKKLKNFEN